VTDMKNNYRHRLAPWIATAAFFILWELACRIFNIDVFILPSPTRVVEALYENLDGILVNAAQTLIATLIGFAIAVFFGVIMGLLLGSIRLFYDAMYPLMISFNSIPKVAIIPILVIWFGIGTVPAIITAFTLSFFPIVVNVAAGLATIEPELKDVLRSLGAHRYQILMKIGLPRSMPYFFAALKISIGLAFIGTVTAETIASNSGIGYLMMSASGSFNVPLVFAGLVVVAAMGITMYQIFAKIEKSVTFWALRGEDARG